jgi:hypothetical protein
LKQNQQSGLSTNMDVLLIYALECELQSSVSRMQSTNLGVLLVLFCLTSGQIAGISGAIGGAVTGGLSTGRPFGALAGAAFGGLSNYGLAMMKIKI